MRLWIATAAMTLPLVLAALFPQSAVSLVSVALSLFVGFWIFGRREMSLLAPLVLAGPLLLRIFPFSPAGRLLVFVLFTSVVWWYAVDLRRRRKGAPLLLDRMKFYFFAGFFPLTATAFSAIENPALKPVALSDVAAKPMVLLGGIALLAASGVFTLRAAADRARALTTTTPSSVDAAFVALFLSEVFVGLSFLPLSPFTMAAIVTVFCWGLIRILLFYRTDRLTSRETIRTALAVFALFAILLVSVPWISVR